MNNVKRCVRPLLMAMLILSPVILTACAARPKPVNVYVEGSSRAVPLKTGQAAPFDGWLISNQAMLDLTECCDMAVKQDN